MFEFAPGASISVESDEAAALEYLDEYFGPAISHRSGEARWWLRIATAGSEAARLRGEGPEDAPAAPWFAFDQWTLELPSWRDGRGRLVGDDAERGCVLALEPGRLEIHADPAPMRWRFSVVIAIHEMIGAQLRGSALEVHAAAIEVGGRAVLIAGPKGAGKTTVCLELLRGGTRGWLANDRVFVGLEAGAPIVRGVPTSIKVPPAMADAFPELSAGLPELEGRHHIHSLAELARGVAPEADPPEVRMLNMAQAASCLGVERRGPTPLGALLFPRLSPGLDGRRLRPLGPEQAADELWKNLFGSVSRRRSPTAIELCAGGAALAPRQMADAIAATVPAWELELGRDAYGDGFAAAVLEGVSA